MSLRHPEVFRLLFFLVPLLALTAMGYFSGRKAAVRLRGGWRGKETRDIYFVRWFFSSLGLGLFALFTILSLAGFSGKIKRESFAATGWDTIFVLDISRSMYAQDTPPSRLERGRSLIHGITDSLDSGRFGLVVFRGEASRLFPLSEDKEGLINYVHYLSPDLVTSPGTGLNGGLKAAVESFVDGRETRRRIILLSDGGEDPLDYSRIYNWLKDRKADLTVIGLGRTGGSEIPLAGGEWVTGPEGRRVVSRLNETLLTRLAETCQGRYYHGEDPRLFSSLLEDYLAPQGTPESGYIETPGDGFRPYLFLALLALVLHLGARIKPW
ncbi:MAG: VWA domain-containing protein [Spirochaetales bacterium]|jgi:Ca-activated chloride channel family protein|nr:VWA domain-containing protein [Spirochaetales bacterium]